MNLGKTDRLLQVKHDILKLQGFKTTVGDNNLNISLPCITNAFPTKSFPIGCMHEFIGYSQTDIAATAGFILGLLHNSLQQGGTCLWIGPSPCIYPPAIQQFGVKPEQIIFININKEKDLLYCTEEALKCNKLTAVFTEIKSLDFKISRRFQLAAEQSRVTGFILRNQPKILNTIACVSRWHVSQRASALPYGMPGVGFPAWNVDLQKVRNGHPGKWQIEWAPQGLCEVKENIIPIEQKQQLRQTV